MKATKVFKSVGFVYGNLWGGGSGAYPARELTAKSKKTILNQVNKGLDGSLDSGMGYESLIGAILEITTITTVNIKGKPYTNKKANIEFIGNLTEKQKDFLYEVLMND